MFRSRPLQVERLEDRSVPAVFGLPWPDASKLSLSFAPDGTSVDNQSSALFSTLNSISTTSWKTEILRAFQTWAVEANINIGVVSDGGQAFGISGAVEGDSRFGDIRIGAKAHDTHLAMNSPFSMISQTRAGDVLLNTTKAYGIADPNKFDLYSVMLHESGNVFGVADNLDSSSAMYTFYNGVRTGLSGADVTALQALYGAREADAFEGTTGNNDFSTATSLSGTVSGDITTHADVDYFNFTATSSTMTLRVKAQGVSLLTPRLTIYDSAHNVVATAETTNALENTVVIQLDGLVSGQQYFAVVEGSVSDVFGIGSYQLTLHNGSSSALPSAPNNNVFDDGNVQRDYHLNDVMLSATNLDRTIFSTDTRFDHRLRGKIEDATDVDWYKLAAPEDGGTSMMVMVNSLSTSSLRPKVTVYNSAGTLVAAEVLVNEQGSYVVQVANPVANAEYYLKVQAASLVNNTGNYFLGVDFRPELVTLSSAGSAVLHATNLEDWRTLNNAEGQVFHFALSSTGDNLLGVGVRMTVYDSNNNVVLTLVSKEGETVTDDVYLAGGQYNIRFEGGMQDSSILMPVTYDLRITNVTDPIDPMPLDPNAPNPGIGPSFDWVAHEETYYSFLDQVDPYSNPWTGG